jgi:uncharacterized membrane protein YdjX (TVP38/TMEM64 family)
MARVFSKNLPRLLFVGGCLLVALVLSSDSVYALLRGLLAFAKNYIAPHPVGGALVFVLLAALSAMLAFFSSAVLMPVAVVTWGAPLSAALLWMGWLLGGICAYSIGRFLGRPVVQRLVSEEDLEAYGDRLSVKARFPLVLLFQLALPSEIPGYLFGMARVRFAIYLPALALAELPYALGTLLLSQSLVERRVIELIGIGIMAVLAGAYSIRLLHAHLSR